MLRISGVGLSHVGLVRSGNEDSGFVGPTCMLVADGVGGAAAGEVASATTAYIVSAMAMAHRADDPVLTLREAISLAQEQVASGVRRDPARAGMATTLTALLTDGSTFALAHVGDSRGYVFRDGDLVQVTRDHTFVQRLVDEGSLPPEEVREHPWRNVVLRSINGNPEETGDVGPISLAPGDRVLLVSDGVSDLVDPVRLEAILARNPDDEAAQLIVDEALAFGGRDNITCLLASIVEGGAAAADGMLLGAVRDPYNVVDAAAVSGRTA
ncbi:MAG: protein phosphatase 2C domain-containing protein [Marmoricola sp.]